MLLSYTQEYAAIPQSARAVRRTVADLAFSSGFQAHDAHDIVVAVGEAVANAIEHSGSPGFSVHAECNNQKISISVEDFGRGFDLDPGSASRPAPDERGRGIYLMSHLMDRVTLQKKHDRGSIVQLEKVKRAERPDGMLRPWGAGFISFAVSQSV